LIEWKGNFIKGGQISGVKRGVNIKKAILMATYGHSHKVPVHTIFS